MIHFNKTAKSNLWPQSSTSKTRNSKRIQTKLFLGFSEISAENATLHTSEGNMRGAWSRSCSSRWAIATFLKVLITLSENEWNELKLALVRVASSSNCRRYGPWGELYQISHMIFKHKNIKVFFISEDFSL